MNYSFKVGDIIYHPKLGIFEITKIDIDYNQHGIELGYTYGKIYPNRGECKEMNQILEYNIKNNFYSIMQKEVYELLYGAKYGV